MNVELFFMTYTCAINSTNTQRTNSNSKLYELMKQNRHINGTKYTKSPNKYLRRTNKYVKKNKSWHDKWINEKERIVKGIKM
jgi:hypothetical protein